MDRTKGERIFLVFSFALALFLSFPLTAAGMHIIEGFFPVSHCVAWGVLCLPFLAAGIISIRRTLKRNKRLIMLLAMSGAFIFVISSLKIPSVSGSSSHMTGTGLSAILFGPAVTCVLGIIVLVFQAVLLAHGGLTTLGANAFSTAIAGPAFAWLLYRLGRKLNFNRKANVFIAAVFGDLITYSVTSLQLAIAYPAARGGVMASAIKFLLVFAPTQAPLIAAGGLLTVFIIIGLERFAEPELKEISFI